MKPLRILVSDGEQRAALAIVRALGSTGHTVFVCSEERGSLAGGSRHCSGEAPVRDALLDADGFVHDVRALIARWSIDTLIPVAEPAMLALLGNREVFPGVLIPFPELSTFRAISDKERLLAAAPSAGISVPRQHVHESARAPLPVLRYPLVIKPARTVSGEGEASVKLAVFHAADEGTLKSRLEELPSAAFPVLLQERIIGPGIGIFVLVWNGRLHAAFAHRRIREKPPSGGVSVYRESAPMNEVLLAQSLALLEQFQWQGVAMVEYKVDAHSGTPYLMEVNGRFWGSLQLAIDAGVDFPSLLLEAAQGAPTRFPIPSYHVGTRSRWFWGDVDHLLARLRRSASVLSLPPEAPGRLRVILDFCHIGGRNDHGEVFRWSDPRPFLRETRSWWRALRPR